MHTINCTTSNEMWVQLHSVFESKSQTNIHLLQQQWYTLNRDPADKMSTHISIKIQDLSHKLKAMGETISDGMIMNKMLMTLPQNLKHFISAWESTSDDQRTIQNLIPRLVTEESRIQTDECNQNTALLVTKRTGKGNFKKFNKSKSSKPERCYDCGNKGHWRKECWSKPKSVNSDNTEDQQQDNPSFSSNYKKKRNPERALITDVALTVPDCIKDSAQKWFLDSAACSHMSHNKKWFSEYTQF